MLRPALLLPCVLLAGPLCSIAPVWGEGMAAAIPQGRQGGRGGDNEKALEVLNQWLLRYRKQAGRRDQGWDVSNSLRHDKLLVHEHGLTSRRMSYKNELELLLRRTSALDNVDAARAVLRIAAVGLDRKVRYTPRMVPHTVRHLGEEYLTEFTAPEVLDFLAGAARGRGIGSGSFRSAAQAAALREIGARKVDRLRPILEEQLQVFDATVRIGAVVGLPRMASRPAIQALVQRLQKEAERALLIEILHAVDSLHRSGKVSDEAIRHAAIAAAGALGRARSWRADVAIVNFLMRYRYKNSIPALIGLLEKVARKAGTEDASGVLRKRLHEALVSLTGARFPADQPRRWRDFWNREGDKLDVAKVNAASHGQETQSRFFNIPVRGLRVVFVIDQSGSMAWMMNVRGRTSAGGRGAQRRKLDVARDELIKAVRALPKEAKFNVLAYSTTVKAWKKKLVKATDRQKKDLEAWARQLQPLLSTNIFDAMKMALRMKSLVYGDRYASNVDEIFLLSDGAPTDGEVVDAVEIAAMVRETNKHSGVRINTVYLEGSGWGRGGPGRGGPGRGGPGRGGPGRGGPGRGGPGQGGQGRGGPGQGGFGRPVPQRINGAELMRRLAKQNNGRFVKP